MQGSEKVSYTANTEKVKRKKRKNGAERGFHYNYVILSPTHVFVFSSGTFNRLVALSVFLCVCVSAWDRRETQFADKCDCICLHVFERQIHFRELDMKMLFTTQEKRSEAMDRNEIIMIMNSGYGICTLKLRGVFLFNLDFCKLPKYKKIEIEQVCK